MYMQQRQISQVLQCMQKSTEYCIENVTLLIYTGQGNTFTANAIYSSFLLCLIKASEVTGVQVQATKMI